MRKSKIIYIHLFVSIAFGVMTLGNGTKTVCNIISCSTYYNSSLLQLFLTASSLLYLVFVLLKLFKGLPQSIGATHQKGQTLKNDNAIYKAKTKNDPFNI